MRLIFRANRDPSLVIPAQAGIQPCQGRDLRQAMPNTIPKNIANPNQWFRRNALPKRQNNRYQ